MKSKSKIKFLTIGTVILLGLLSWNLCKAQFFVDINAKGNNDGSSWGNAYTDLQTAIDIVEEGNQLWVATGTYFPGKSGDPKGSSFYIKKGIHIYGGFTGIESELSERNPSKYPTILSGDLNQDDILDDFITNRSDNVWTVMKVENTTTSIPIIDGITFKSGHSDSNDESYESSKGGGLFLFGPTLLSNCSFAQNYSTEAGGALFLIDSLGIENKELRIENCQFTNNQSFSGGAVNISLMSSKVTSIIIQHSNFSNNTSEEDGGGLSIFSSAK